MVLIREFSGVWMGVSERTTKSRSSDVCERLTSRIVMSSSTSPSSCGATTEEGQSQRGRRERRLRARKAGNKHCWMELDADKHNVEPWKKIKNNRASKRRRQHFAVCRRLGRRIGQTLTGATTSPAHPPPPPSSPNRWTGMEWVTKGATTVHLMSSEGGDGWSTRADNRDSGGGVEPATAREPRLTRMMHLQLLQTACVWVFDGLWNAIFQGV